MSKSLDRLIAIVPPPANPVAPGSPQEWLAVEEELGCRLPEDFKDYTITYGAGQWVNFFGILNPFYKWKHPQANQSWREWRQMRLSFLDEWQTEHPERVAPFRRYPAPEGLLAFGYDDNGGTLCWRTSGPPDGWEIICLDSHLSREYDRFKVPLTTFLSDLLTQRDCPTTFPDSDDFYPLRRPLFRPYTTE